MLVFAYIDGMTPIKIVFKLFFQYLMLHMFYYSGIWYPVFMTDILIPVLEVHLVKQLQFLFCRRKGSP